MPILTAFFGINFYTFFLTSSFLVYKLLQEYIAILLLLKVFLQGFSPRNRCKSFHFLILPWKALARIVQSYPFSRPRKQALHPGNIA